MRRYFVKQFFFSKKWCLVLIILLIATIFRFYNFNNWLFWGMDQEYEALIAKNILTGNHFPLIGVNAGDTGIYLGPGFNYFSLIPFILFKGDPIGWAITASCIGIFVCYLVYKVGKEMFSSRVGVFASLFYSGSFLTSFYDRKFWNPTPVPLLSLLIGYFLFQILRGRGNRLIFLAVVFGLSLHVHLSLLIFLPLIIYVLWKKRSVFSRKILIWAIAIFIVLQLPLVIFEFRHNFLNSKAVLNFLLDKKQSTTFSTFAERNSLFLSALGRFFWVPPAPDLFLESGQCRQLAWLRKNAYPEGIILVLLGIAIFIWWYLHKKKRLHPKSVRFDFTSSTKVIIWIFLLTIPFIGFYNHIFFEYYLLFFFPWLAIALGKSADFIWERQHGSIIVTLIFFLFIALNLTTLFTSFFSYSYREKMEAIKFVKTFVGEKEYSLEAVGECPRFGGYRYLFEHFVSVPVSSYMDSYFNWLYYGNMKNKKPSRIVLFSLIDSRDTQETIVKWEEAKFKLLTEFDIVAEKRFDKIQVLILTLPANLRT